MYLDQARVLSVVQIFENALFPITSRFSCRSFEAWCSLAPFITCVTFGSSWTLSARGPLRSLLSWKSLWALDALTSWFPRITFVPKWSCRSSRAGWSRNTCWSRGSRAPGNTRDPWRAKESTISTGSIWWIWVSALNVESNLMFFLHCDILCFSSSL